MPRSIEVRFVVGGTSEVLRAFDSIDKRAERAEQGQRRAANEDVARTRKTANEKVREDERATREREKLLKRYEQQQIKLSEQSLKAVQKAVDEKTRIEERFARAVVDFAHRASLAKQRELEREVVDVERAERRKAQAREKWARAMGNRVGSSVGGLASRAVSMSGMALSVGGGFAIADVVHQHLAAERAAAQLVAQVTTGGTAPSGANVNAILQQASGVSIRTGMNKAEVVGGALAYSRGAKGGDFGGAMANMDFFAKMSKVTGTSIDEVASAAGVLQSQNADLGKDPAAMRQMLLSAYAQSKAGSVSFQDAAKQLGTLGSTRGFYQGNEGRNQAVLMGLGQIAAPGGSADEIGTFIKDVSTEAAQHRHAKGKFRGLENMGVKFNSTGQMESPEQMIGAVLKSTNGDLGQIGEIFGKRGLPLFTQLAGTYRNAGGGDQGVSAVQSEIAKVTGASMSEKDLQSQFETMMSTPAEKFAAATERVKDAIEQKLTPWLERFADKLPELLPKIEKFIDVMGRMVDWASGHPMEAVIAALAAAILKGGAEAAVADALKKVIFGGGGGGGGGGGVKAVAGALSLAAGWEAGKWGVGKMLGRTNEQIEAVTPSAAWDWYSSGGVVTGGVAMGDKNAGLTAEDAHARFLASRVHAASGSGGGGGTGWDAGTHTSYGLGNKAPPPAHEQIAKDTLTVLKSIDSKISGGSHMPSNDQRTNPLGTGRTGTQ